MQSETRRWLSITLPCCQVNLECDEPPVECVWREKNMGEKQLENGGDALGTLRTFSVPFSRL